MQDLLAASLWIGMGSRILTALTSACTAAIQLFAIGSMTIAHQSITLTMRTVKGDGYHRRLLFLGIDCSSKSTISCLFVPLPKSEVHPITTCPMGELLLSRCAELGRADSIQLKEQTRAARITYPGRAHYARHPAGGALMRICPP